MRPIYCFFIIYSCTLVYILTLFTITYGFSLSINDITKKQKVIHHHSLKKLYINTNHKWTTTQFMMMTQQQQQQQQTEKESVEILRFIQPDTNDEWVPLHPNCFQRYIDDDDDDDGDNSLVTSSYYYPQIAASVESARSILNPWIFEIEEAQQQGSGWSTEWKAMTYYDRTSSSSSNMSTDDSNNIPLHGYLIRNAKYHHSIQFNQNKKKDNNHDTKTIILFFPTAVGVHDIFLFYKASQIVNQLQFNHCTIMIIDLFSDQSGWLWNKNCNIDQYNTIRNDLLQHDHNINDLQQHQPRRPILQNRINAALDYLHTSYITTINTTTTTTTTIAALGWCFGGHCIAELARMDLSRLYHHNKYQLHAMITFHGVFAGLEIPTAAMNNNNPNSIEQQQLDEEVNNMPLPSRKRSEILICHGVHDPFVPSSDLEKALSLFQYYGYTTSLLQLDARHGFTNPSQVHNTNPAFQYHPESANKAWHQALALLSRRIGKM